MSKYDNLFKNTRNNISTSNNTSTYTSKYNSFGFKENNVIKKATYDYKDTEFPDLKPDETPLIISSKTVASYNKKYADITAIETETDTEKKLTNDLLVPPGWVYYSRTKVLNKHNLFDATYGSLSKKHLEEEERNAKKKEPLYIHQQMVTTLMNTWSKYKIQYDLLHGENAYDLVYYTEPIYSSDTEDEDDDDYETDKLINDQYNYNSQDDYNPRNYSQIPE